MCKIFLQYVVIYFLLSQDKIREQTREMRSTQRQIARDRGALEKQEKQLVGDTHTSAHTPITSTST